MLQICGEDEHRDKTPDTAHAAAHHIASLAEHVSQRDADQDILLRANARRRR